MAIRTYDLLLDSYNSTMPEPIVGRQGDRNGAVTLNVTLSDRGNPIYLSGQTINLMAETANGTAIIADNGGVTITDATNGKFTYAVPNALWSEAGKIKKAYFSLIDNKGQQTTYDLIFIVKQSIDIDQKHADDYVTIIDGTIRSLKEKTDAVIVPETFTNLDAIKAKYPNGKNGVMVAANDGHKYIWNGSSWVDSGVYQAVGFADGSITAPKLASNTTFGFIYPGSTPLRYNTKTKTLLFPPDTNVGYKGGSNYVIVNNTDNNIELEVGDRGWIYVDTLTGEPGFSQYPIQNQNAVAIGGKLSDATIYVNGPYLIDGLEPLSQFSSRDSVNIYESKESPDYNTTAQSIHFYDEYAFISSPNPIQIVNDSGEKDFDFDIKNQTGFILIDRFTGVIQKELSSGDFETNYVVIGAIRYNGKLKLNGLFTVDGTYYDDFESSPNYNIYFSDTRNAFTWNTVDRKIVFHEANVNYGRNTVRVADQTLTYSTEGTYFVYYNKRQKNFQIEQPPLNISNSRIQVGFFNTYNLEVYLHVDPKCIKITPKSQSDYDLSTNDNLTFVGDSITYGLYASNSSHSYPSIISKNANINVYNEGVSGATWQNGSGNDTISLVTRSKSIDFTRGNTIVLFAGTNDFAQSLPIGALADTTDKTMLGAINLVIQNIYSKNPVADILLILPMWRARINDANAPVDIESTTNSIGQYLKDYNEAIMSAGEYYHFPVLDLYHVFGVNKLNYTQWLADGLHPNDAGYAKLANVIGNFVALQ